MVLQLIRTVLFAPNTFFARREASRLSFSALIVVVLGLLGVARPLLTVFRLDSDSVGGVLPVLLVVAFGGVFVVWALYSMLFHGLSALFGAEGSLRDVITVTGWGFLPSVFHSALLFAIGIVLLDPASSGDVHSQTAMQMMSSGPLFDLLLRFIELLFTLWSATIWVAGIQHVRKVSRREAIISVGIPVAIFTVLSLVDFSIPA
ncbi:Yip1 domain-containing protein [Haladaptatus litoreus]|uniref:Yip1 domain-containing protein n=1 Tax=Haladaptatus litoreus TaxID=553468 RepID=A0A1N6X378_9EURY|nr:YIP1 family protein [Haladaptatus litoreus]SIQ96757.1 Yip1 domain-containing protein [Haladaptatus litoreus]